jgi:hypothetical protein
MNELLSCKPGDLVFFPGDDWTLRGIYLILRMDWKSRNQVAILFDRDITERKGNCDYFRFGSYDLTHVQIVSRA